MKFAEKIDEFVQKWKIVKIFWNDFTLTGKDTQPPSKGCVWTKAKANPGNFQENFEILDNNRCIDFFHNFLLNTFWSSPSSESIYPWKITPDFYNKFQLKGEDRSRLLWSVVQRGW